MEGHRLWVTALAVSQDGQMIASGDTGGEIIAWHAETGESLTKPIKAHSSGIYSVDFSPDGTVLATGSYDGMTKFWCTKTWQMQGDPIECGLVKCVRYSPSGELLAIATYQNDIHIHNPGTREGVASLTARATSLAWTPDGTRLLSGGGDYDPTIREWDPLTWQQVGRPWKGHTHDINAIAIHPDGTLVASASNDKHVCLWRLSDQQPIAIFQHSSDPTCVTFSVDGRHILSGGQDNKISEWELPKGTHSKASLIASWLITKWHSDWDPEKTGKPALRSPASQAFSTPNPPRLLLKFKNSQTCPTDHTVATGINGTRENGAWQYKHPHSHPHQ
jgi:WD40 repeat protein